MGDWLSRLERTVHIREVTGSNPVSPTIAPSLGDHLTDSPLRIVILTDSYLPYLSGVTVSTEALARGLMTGGHDVLLLAPRPAVRAEPGTAGATGPQPEIAWLHSEQLPAPAPRGYRVPLPMNASALHRAVEFGPQIVHVQSPFVAGRLGRRLARRINAPLVFTHHTRFTDYRHYLGPLARPGAALLDRQLLRFWRACAAVIAPGTDLADEIRSRLGTGDAPLVRAIPTGIEVATIAAAAAIDPRQLAAWPADAVVIASLGRLAPEKSPDLLLAAFRVAVQADPRLRLLLVGGGPSLAALRGMADAEGLAGLVHLTGQLPRLEALSLLKGSDLFAFASRTETQGLVVAEALAAGLPVVARDAPGVRDAVRHGVDGLLVNDGPAAELSSGLAEAMLAIGSDAALRRERSAAALAGSVRFDRAARIAEVVSLYRQIISQR